MAADVIQFMNQLQLPQVVVVGHSMGGKVAQAMALLYPDRVEGMIVLDIAPVTYTEQHDVTWQTVCHIIRTLVQVTTTDRTNNHNTTTTTTTPLTKKQLDVLLRNDIPDAALRAFCCTNWDDRTGQWKIPLQDIAHQLPTLAAFDVVDDTNNDHNNLLVYNGDVFFIHGGQSRFVRHAHLPYIQHYFPNHMLTTIRGCGHWVHAEAPEDTLSLVLQFLDR
jgi:pimeloyl-ACP methyl ester carboxylesterase